MSAPIRTATKIGNAKIVTDVMNTASAVSNRIATVRYAMTAADAITMNVKTIRVSAAMKPAATV